MKLTAILYSILLSSCAFDYAKDPSGMVYASSRFGSDTKYKHVKTGGGFEMTVVDEKTSDSFRQIATVAKWLTVSTILRDIAGTVGDTITKN